MILGFRLQASDVSSPPDRPIRSRETSMTERLGSSAAGICPPSPPVVLVVDNDESAAELLSRLLAADGYTVHVARDGRSALSSIAKIRPDAVLMEPGLPDIDGFEICRRLKRNETTRLTPVVLVSQLTAKQYRLVGWEAGADSFFTKPVDEQEVLTRLRSLVRVKRYTDDLDSATSIVVTLAVMIESRDGYKEGHCHRIANHATALGRCLQLGDRELQALHRGGFLHDIGMLTIPEPVLRKSGQLKPEEYELVKSHTVVGASLVEGLRSLQAVEPIIRYHHERFDGSGYPDGLQHDQIPLLAQIIGLVDVYDAITTQRPYQDARSAEEGIAVLKDQAARGWRRPDLVDRFVELIQAGKVSA
jgi:putative two-component system response regulator